MRDAISNGLYLLTADGMGLKVEGREEDQVIGATLES
jgi:hypothetical protein